MKLKDLLLVADCNYHVFFKSEIANISGLPYEEIGTMSRKRTHKIDKF